MSHTPPTVPRDQSDLPAWTAQHPLLYVSGLWYNDGDLNKRTLGMNGLAVATLRDPDEVLVLCQTVPISLVLTEYNLGGTIRTGIALMQQIKATPSTAHIPVAFLSLYGDARSIIKAMHTGAVNYFPKGGFIGPNNAISSLRQALLEHGNWRTPPDVDHDRLAALNVSQYVEWWKKRAESRTMPPTENKS